MVLLLSCSATEFLLSPEPRFHPVQASQPLLFSHAVQAFKMPMEKVFLQPSPGSSAVTHTQVQHSNSTSTMVSPGDTIMCQPQAQDGYGGGATDLVSVVVENTPPEITATISVSGSGNSAELTCIGTASDADDSTAPSIAYEWFDNSNASLGSTNPLRA